MKNLNELDLDVLQYLKGKWNVDIIELEREIKRSTDRLNVRIERQSVNEQALDEAKAQLQNAESVLQHLTSTSAPQDMQDRQQAAVDKANLVLQDVQLSGNALTDGEIILQQVNIDELVLSRQYREDKVTEIDQLLATTEGRTE